MKILIRILLLLSTLIISCSPKLISKDFSPPIMDLEPAVEKDREFAKMLQQLDQFEVEWKGKVSTSEVHEVIQGMLDLSNQYKNPKLKTAAGQLYKKYYSEAVGTRVSFFKTPYYELFQNEALPNVRDAINSTGVRLDKDMEKVLARLDVLKSEYQWPKKATYKESMDLIAAFLDSFADVVKKMKVYAEFEDVLIKEVKEEKRVNLEYLANQLKLIEGKKTLDNMLNVMESMVKEFDIPLDKEALGQIESGRKLSTKIEQVKDENSAFVAIVAVWLMLDVKDRETYFTPISAQLYKFLSGQKDADLLCLAEKTCPKFFTSIIRDFAILPQLKKFGPEKIKVTLNDKTHGFVLAILEERLFGVVVSLDTRIIKKITKNMAKAKDKLDTVRKNAPGFTKDKFLVWLKENLDLNNDLTLGYEYSTVEIDMQKNAVSFMVPDQARNLVTSQTIGTSLGSNAKIVGTDILTEKHLRRTIMEQVNRVMGFGGLPNGKDVTSGLTRNFGIQLERFDVGIALNSNLSFGLADVISLSSPYQRKDLMEAATVSAGSQIDLGQGLLSMTYYLRDWHPNSFDNLLGKYTASDVFGSDSGGGNPYLFSKTDFFGMVTAQFLNWISNLTKEYSQVALISDKNEIVWLNEYSKNKDKTLLYGVYVDVVQGEKSREVQLEPMVKLIRLLASIQESVKGIENTRFKELLKKDTSDPECADLKSAKCPTLAQMIGKRVEEVKQIMLPLGNTIAAKFRKQRDTGKPGQAWGTIKLPSMEAEESDPTLKNQLLVIEALIYVYEATKIESYLWSAKETYGYLQKYYNPKTNFFEMDSKVASVPVLVQMLRSFKIILPFLDDSEKALLTEKIKFWELSLERIR